MSEVQKMRLLQRGDTGSDVRTAQTALIRAGYDPGAANGVFGAATERAVIQFQRVLGARQEGIIGPVTWQFLEPFVEIVDEVNGQMVHPVVIIAEAGEFAFDVEAHCQPDVVTACLHLGILDGRE